MIISVLTWLTQKTRQDCFCGSRDQTPSSFGFNNENKSAGHLSNLNSKLRENYEIASIVNYIDIFISKLNRLNLRKHDWPEPFKMSGVKNLDFFEEENEFNVKMQHQISQNLFLALHVQVPVNYKTKHHFNLMGTLVRTNVPTGTKIKGATASITQSKTLNYDLKRASLSHFYGNQLAVDVCRFMYACLNKILTEFFSLDLKTVVYKEVGRNLKSHRTKKDCIVTPSFKVYLGVSQIEKMITDTRQLMAITGTKNSNQMAMKLKKQSDLELDLSIVNIPKLERRKSSLLMPVIMEQDGREMLAADYEGTEEYQERVRQAYFESAQDYLNESIDQIEPEISKNQKIEIDYQFSQEVNIQHMDPRQIEDQEVVQADRSGQKTPMLEQHPIELQFQAKEIPGVELINEIAMEEIQNKRNNIVILEKLIQDAIIENYEFLPKTKEAKSEGYLTDLYRSLDLKAKNSALLRQELGIDLDEDGVELDMQKQQIIENYLKSQFILLRTTPLETDVNRNFRTVFGSHDFRYELEGMDAPQNKGKLLQRSHSMYNRQSKKIKMGAKANSHRQVVKIIGTGESITLSNGNDFNDRQILQDGLSSISEVEISNLDLRPKEYSRSAPVERKVELMFSKNNFGDDEEVFNQNAQFDSTKNLSEIERNEMIKKIIQVRAYIHQNNIKCDFEVYTDNTMFINMPDLELSELLNQLTLIMEAGVEEDLPVLVTNQIVQTFEKKDDLEIKSFLEIQESRDQNGKITAEVIIDLPGYTAEQVQKMILMMTQDEAFMDINNTPVNDEKQDEMDQIHLLGYDITEYIANDLT